MRFYELKGKSVVEISNGKIIGEVCDLVFDCNNYEVVSLCVKKHQNGVKRWLSWLFNEHIFLVCVDEIDHLQGDVILINHKMNGFSKDI